MALRMRHMNNDTHVSHSHYPIYHRHHKRKEKNWDALMKCGYISENDKKHTEELGHHGI